MATDMLVQPDPGRVGAKDPGKRRAKRLGTLTGVVFGFFALGIALAFFAGEPFESDNSATGGKLQFTATGLQMTAGDLFPTTVPDGGDVARTQNFTLKSETPVPVAFTMTAIPCETDACGWKKGGSAQWPHLYISVRERRDVGDESSEGRLLYYGRLADMHTAYSLPEPQSATSPSPPSPPSTPEGSGANNPGVNTGGPVNFGTFDTYATKNYVARVWLEDSGERQEQGVTNEWTFKIDAKTTRDVRTAPSRSPSAN